MTHPANMSLKGICDWAVGNAGQRQDPPLGQDINAHKLDGMDYADMKAEWEAFALANGGGGGGVVAMGTANFTSNGGYTTVSIGITMPNTNYMVYVVPSADGDSRIGEYWVPEANKTTTNFRVYNDGSAVTQFKWAVATQSSGTSDNTAGGDLSGAYPNPTVAKIQGIPVSTTDPTDGQVLVYKSASGQYEPGNGGGSTGAGGVVVAAGAFSVSIHAASKSFTISAPGAKVGDVAIVSGSGSVAWAIPSSYAVGLIGVCTSATVSADDVISVTVEGLVDAQDVHFTLSAGFPGSGYTPNCTYSGSWLVARM